MARNIHPRASSSDLCVHAQAPRVFREGGNVKTRRLIMRALIDARNGCTGRMRGVEGGMWTCTCQSTMADSRTNRESWMRLAFICMSGLLQNRESMNIEQR